MIAWHKRPVPRPYFFRNSPDRQRFDGFQELPAFSGQKLQGLSMGFQNQGFPQAKLNEIHGAWGDTKNMAPWLRNLLS